MYWYWVQRERGWLPHFYREQVEGLPLLRAEVTKLCDFKAVLRRLKRETCLNEWETAELWKHKAAELALLQLEQEGIPAAAAVVGLHSTIWTASVERAAEMLSQTVRGLALEVPDGESLAWRYQRRWGLPISIGRGDVTLCFTQTMQTGNCISLYGSGPTGYRAELPRCTLPEGCPNDAALLVLCTTGRCSWSEVQICPKEEASFGRRVTDPSHRIHDPSHL